MYLGNWTEARGNQSETLVTFALPDTAADFGVNVMTSASPAPGAFTQVGVRYTPGQGTAQVYVSKGNATAPPMLTQYMENTDLPGGASVGAIVARQSRACLPASYALPRRFSFSLCHGAL